MAQDYMKGLFVDDALGTLPSTMTTKGVNLKDSSLI
jgi:hypothetical protein